MSGYPFRRVGAWLVAGALPGWLLVLLLLRLGPTLPGPGGVLWLGICVVLPIGVWPLLAASFPPVERSRWGVVGAALLVAPLAADLGLRVGLQLLVEEGERLDVGGHGGMGSEGIVLIASWVGLSALIFAVLVLPRLFVPSLRPGALAPTTPRATGARVAGWLIVASVLSFALFEANRLREIDRAIEIGRYCRLAEYGSERASVHHLGDVSHRSHADPPEDATWIDAGASDVALRARDDGANLNQLAVVRVGREPLRFATIRYRSASRDWSNEVTYCFREDGSLLRMISTLDGIRLGMGNPTRISIHDARGRLEAVYGDAPEPGRSAEQPGADVLLPQDVPVYEHRTDLPFYFLLASSSLAD